MPDGSLPFCHRLIDKPWVYGNLATKQFDISKAINFISGYHHSNHPECIKCPVRNLCHGQCVGASYEYWGDPWTPIHAICDYIICKNFVLSRIFDDWGKVTEQTISAENVKKMETKCNNIFDNYNYSEHYNCNNLDEYILNLKSSNMEK